MALVVDNTAASPVLVRPGDLGAAIVIHSTSKYINGHGTAIGGVLVDTGAFDWSVPRYAHLRPYYDRARQFALVAYLRQRVHRDFGGCFSPFNAFLMSIGMETMALRIEKHGSNARQIATWLAGHPAGFDVRYPGLPGHPDHAVAARQFSSRFGGLLTLRLGSRERAFRFINALRLARNLANIGDTRTLVIHPASTICREASPDDRQAMGVTDDLVRLSIGIEHPDDIRADLEQALQAAS